VEVLPHGQTTINYSKGGTTEIVFGKISETPFETRYGGPK
jgi:hypothetical protein